MSERERIIRDYKIMEVAGECQVSHAYARDLLRKTGWLLQLAKDIHAQGKTPYAILVSHPLSEPVAEVIATASRHTQKYGAKHFPDGSHSYELHFPSAAKLKAYKVGVDAEWEAENWPKKVATP